MKIINVTTTTTTTMPDANTSVKILIASGSIAKINAVKLGTKAILDLTHSDIVVEPIFHLESGVSEQPMSDAETIAGARNRLVQITSDMMREKGAEFALSIEGGLETNAHDSQQSHLQCFAWVCLKHRDSENFISETRSSTFVLPDIVRKKIMEGKEELGTAQDAYFSQFDREDSGMGKGEAGTIGPLTFGAVSRSQYYAPAVTFAFIPFLHQLRNFSQGIPPNSLACPLHKKSEQSQPSLE
jgi:non-canonical (house-cleaning) NTP pyrophosphatase